MEGRGTTGTAEWTAAEVGAAAAVLLWLAPAASHCRWFKVMDKPGSFPLCSAVAADINRMLAAAGLEMPRSAFVAHLAKPSVVPRPPALGVGRMQHGAMRSQMATCHASAEAILAEIDAFADGKAPLPPLDKVDKLARLFGHFVVVIDAHSVMEDDLIYHELERACESTATRPPVAAGTYKGHCSPPGLPAITAPLPRLTLRGISPRSPLALPASQSPGAPPCTPSST